MSYFYGNNFDFSTTVYGDHQEDIPQDAPPPLGNRVTLVHYFNANVARGFIALHHIRLANNLADILTKHWSHGSFYSLLKPVFHHAGNTASLYKDDTPGCLDHKVTKTGASNPDVQTTSRNGNRVQWNQHVQWKTLYKAGT